MRTEAPQNQKFAEMQHTKSTKPKGSDGFPVFNES